MIKLYLVWHPSLKSHQVNSINTDLLSNFKLKNKVNVLASFYFLKDKTLPYDFLLDSGAYSAFTTGESIDINKYIEYIRKNNIKEYFNLDVIGSPEATYENQKYMEKAGLKPIPTFHAKEDIKYLKRYIDEGHTYIALGGVAQLRNRKLIYKWLKWCFSFIPCHVRVHGFAITSQYLIEKFPFYSCDSSSWTSSARYGAVTYFSNGKFKKLNKKFENNKKTNSEVLLWNLNQWKKYSDHLEAKK